MNPWVSHVKKYALDNNLSYKDALLLAKDTYNKPKIIGQGIGSSRQIDRRKVYIDDRPKQSYVREQPPKEDLKSYQREAVRREREKKEKDEYNKMTVAQKREYNIAKKTHQRNQYEVMRHQDYMQGSGQTQGRTARIHPSNQFDPLIQEQLTAYIVETAHGHGPLSSLGRLRSLDRRVRNGRANQRDLETYQELYQNFLNNDTIDDISIDIE
jgi:hypothetical protein